MNNNLYIPSPYNKQLKFFSANSKYIAYGGARGGGKSWAARMKALLLALRYNGIQILLLRRTLMELRENHTVPLLKILKNIAVYKDQNKEFIFPNGSRIVLGYCALENDAIRYQGQAYEVIFLEEATQFTEIQFQTLTESNRSSGLCEEYFTPRMYFTCNPGGVGHGWVKRLFIDRNYRNKEKNEDYTFIKSLVYDNKFIMKNSPDYVRTLENLPDDRRKAMLYGDWDIFDGQYFSEFDREIHTCNPFEIPKNWKRYFTMDYGLDKFAAYFIAVDPNKNCYVYKEIYQSDVIIKDACIMIKQIMSKDYISNFLAPPDLWNKRQETGKSVFDIFFEHGINLYKTNNNRIAGWYAVKDFLKIDITDNKKSSKLKIFRNCINLIRTIPALRYSSVNPNDVALEPHELTHGPDALRGFCVYWVDSNVEHQPKNKKATWHSDQYEDYYNSSPRMQSILLEKWGNPF